MKTIYFLFITGAVILAACHTTQKSTASPAPTTTTTTTTVPTTPVPLSPSPFIMFPEPGARELQAIQPRFANATLDQLKKGYTIYVSGACINCHGPKDTDEFTEAYWNEVLDDMSLRAALSVDEKAAVNEYVLALRAVRQGK